MYTDFKETMSEVNYRLSLSTAYKTWREQWHEVHIEVDAYAAIFRDTCFMISEFTGNALTTVQAEDIAERLFYILSTSPDEAMSLATVASKLDVDCPQLAPSYEANMNYYAKLVYHLRGMGIFKYGETNVGHPVLEPLLQVKGELRIILHSKFASAIPQIGEIVGTMDAKGYGLLPGISFRGKSTRRKTPLNQKDREVVSLVSRQKFTVDMEIVRKMQYYVPTMSDSGIPISEKEQEDARTAYYRFVDMAEHAETESTVLQFPTTQDSRGRFYNAATDPAVRLSLRSPKPEGSLTAFEHKLLR